jgi:hypothetical protein
VKASTTTVTNASQQGFSRTYTMGMHPIDKKKGKDRRHFLEGSCRTSRSSQETPKIL